MSCRCRVILSFFDARRFDSLYWYHTGLYIETCVAVMYLLVRVLVRARTCRYLRIVYYLEPILGPE